MYRIEHILLVKELNSNLFGDAIEEELLLAAISSPSANVEMNYERLEFLGTHSARKQH